MTTILAFNRFSNKEKYNKKQRIISGNGSNAGANPHALNHQQTSAEIIIYPGIRRERTDNTESHSAIGTTLYSRILTQNS